MISGDSQEVGNGIDSFTADDATITGAYDTGGSEFDPDNYGDGGGSGPSGGTAPPDYAVPGYPGYGLCVNESLINLTYRSLFCEYNYTHPHIPINVSFVKFDEILKTLFMYEYMHVFVKSHSVDEI